MPESNNGNFSVNLHTVMRINTLNFIVMNKQLLMLFLFICPFVFSQEYPKVIIPGDYPDPSIIREGEDYYMTHSSLIYSPGFLIWHSRDLMNWEPICRALPEYDGSAWAPDLVKYKGKYYIYYPTATQNNFVIWANNIKGPWSKPIDLKVSGIDPGHIVDKDGKRYLYLNAGYIVQLSDDGLSTIGKKKRVYEGWNYPSEWETECMCLESPKLLYKDGFYYMTSAQGGTAGPATSHMAVSARSENVMGPWENSPYNPIVHTYSANEKWWSKGHGTLIDDVNGNWWIVYHAYLKGYHTLGRHTLIEPIEWTKDGWFHTTKNAEQIISKGNKIKNGMELSDNFKKKTLGLQWTFWNGYVPEKVILKKNSLYLNAKGWTPKDGQLLLTTPSDQQYETQVEITLGEGNTGGLLLFYSEKAFAGITSDGQQFTVYENADKKDLVTNNFGNHFFVKIINRNNICEMLASNDGKTWDILRKEIDVSSLHHNNYGSFYSLRIGLFSAIEGKTRFEHFIYERLK